jgi:type I restriction enzyme R subunit
LRGPNIDNVDGASSAFKEAALEEIITDYNNRYNQTFELGTHAKFKKDIAARLAHKDHYKRIESEPHMQLDLLIVVDQMLTGYDSKWINTLYLDKLLEYQNIIQTFSRTNRPHEHDKPFGTIRYYRKPHTMEKNIEKAVELYSGNKPIGLFVPKLGENLESMNSLYRLIKKVFADADEPDCTRIPDDKAACGKFASLFREFNDVLEAAKIQGFNWDQQEYRLQDSQHTQEAVITTAFDENDYLVLALRYKELFDEGSEQGTHEDIPYDIDGYLIEIDTGKIDADYMNSRFDKYITALQKGAEVDQVKSDLHKTFATLTQDEQKYADIFLLDIERGDIFMENGKTLRDYITEYQVKAQADQIHSVAQYLGLDETSLRDLMHLKPTKENINEYGRFDHLIGAVDKNKARTYFESLKGTSVSSLEVSELIDSFLREFLLVGGFDVEPQRRAQQKGSPNTNSPSPAGAL